jgi:hypothetical protein
MPVRAEAVAQSAPVEETSATGTLAAEAPAAKPPAAVEAAPAPASSTPHPMITDTTKPTAASDIDRILERVIELQPGRLENRRRETEADQEGAEDHGEGNRNLQADT